AIFDLFAQAGGKFIDTANRYTEGTSERYLKDFIAQNRDFFVIASKYTLFDRRDDINASGNHRKNMIRSVEHSLKRLGTDYLDILWLHAWDFSTPIEEVLRGMDDLVRAGKVHYLGISDSPAWIVSSANTMAELRGWSSFIGLQIEYSLIQRTAERDLLPMAKHYGMAITPWSPLGAGVLTGKYNDKIDEAGRLTEKSRKLTPRNILIARELTQVASKVGASPAQVALKWLIDQHEMIIPIIGARRKEQLEETIKCLNVEIAPEYLEALDEVSKIEMGFPHDFLAFDTVKDVVFGGNYDRIKWPKSSRKIN
ncbi:MAG: aldo/keto reductase, partial [Bacteroidota bacterium]